MTSEEIFACARKVGLIDKSESGDWFVRPDAEVKEVFMFANLISVVEGLIRSKSDETMAVVREKESDLIHKEIERLRDLSYDRLNKMNSLRVTNQTLKRIQALTEAEKDKEIERLRDAVNAEREVRHNPHDTIRIAQEAGFRIAPSRDGPDEVWGISVYLERFAALVAAAEREACAKLCENIFQTTPLYTTYAQAAQDCAEAIRARGET
mgnify:CR=1 FL=1